MNDQSLALRAESAQLLASALAVEALAEAADPSTAPDVLDDLRAAVAATAGACEAMAAGLIPPAEMICERYSRAAASWSSSGARPPHERLALLLAALHDAASGLRTASEQCRVAAQATPSVSSSGTACSPRG
jgi:hypothetical protein